MPITEASKRCTVDGRSSAATTRLTAELQLLPVNTHLEPGPGGCIWGGDGLCSKAVPGGSFSSQCLFSAPGSRRLYSEVKIRVRFPDPDKSLFLCSLSRALLIPTSLPVQAQLCQPEGLGWAGPQVTSPLQAPGCCGQLRAAHFSLILCPCYAVRPTGRNLKRDSGRAEPKLRHWAGRSKTKFLRRLLTCL